MTRRELTEKWQALRRDFDRVAAHVNGAKVVGEFLADLDAMENSEGYETLSMQQAATLSGYSAEHIARLVRTGLLPNCGRKNKPLIRRSDLPRKPQQSLANSSEKTYNVAADARSILSRQGER
jgi:hypothetical protein